MLKYLVVIVVVFVVGWLLLRGRSREASVSSRKAAGNAPKAMVQCSHCGVHLPRHDAVEDSRGAYCTEAHRLAGPRKSAD